MVPTSRPALRQSSLTLAGRSSKVQLPTKAFLVAGLEKIVILGRPNYSEKSSPTLPVDAIQVHVQATNLGVRLTS
jgi:hypothetical protein